MKIFQSLSLIACIALLLCTSCAPPVWMYLRNTSKYDMEVVLEAQDACFMDQEDIPIQTSQRTTMFRYDKTVEPIGLRTYRKLRYDIPAKVLSHNKVQILLPRNTTLYLGSPDENTSHKQLKIQYHKVISQNTPVYKYTLVDNNSYLQSKGSPFFGYAIYYDIQ